MKIINLRGTSGSGKTYIVLRLMEHYKVKVPVMMEGRKQPLGYRMEFPGAGTAEQPVDTGLRPLFVMGHYENPEGCGGCDNISYGLDFIYEKIYERVALGDNVIFEGLIVASDVSRCIELKRHHELLVVGLDTPLNECITSVNERRAKRGKTDPVNPANTEKKFKALIPQRARFRDAGVDFRLLKRADALAACEDFLGLRRTQASAV